MYHSSNIVWYVLLVLLSTVSELDLVSIISSSLLNRAINAVYCPRGDDGIYIMQHYYHRLATYCMWIRIASFNIYLSQYLLIIVNIISDIY